MTTNHDTGSVYLNPMRDAEMARLVQENRELADVNRRLRVANNNLEAAFRMAVTILTDEAGRESFQDSLRRRG